MIYSKTLFMAGGVLFFTASAALLAQDIEDLLPSLKDKAVILDITARVLENNSEVVWNSSGSKVTIPGKSVGVKLVGSNVVVFVQITPYLNRNGNNFLVIQGQIWVSVPNQGIQYQTTMQTIPIAFGEQVYFFPLGKAPSGENASIELFLKMYPYIDQPPKMSPHPIDNIENEQK
jgi:hypothetical protein